MKLLRSATATTPFSRTCSPSQASMSSATATGKMGLASSFSAGVLGGAGAASGASNRTPISSAVRASSGGGHEA